MLLQAARVAGGVLAFADVVMDIVFAVLVFVDGNHDAWAALAVSTVAFSLLVQTCFSSFGGLIDDMQTPLAAKLVGLASLVAVVRSQPATAWLTKLIESLFGALPGFLLYSWVLVVSQHRAPEEDRLHGTLFGFTVACGVRAFLSTVLPMGVMVMEDTGSQTKARDRVLVAAFMLGVGGSVTAFTAFVAAHGLWGLAALGVPIVFAAGIRHRVTLPEAILSYFAGVLFLTLPFAASFDTAFTWRTGVAVHSVYVAVLLVVAGVAAGDLDGVCSDQEAFEAGGCFHRGFFWSTVGLCSASVALAVGVVLYDWRTGRGRREAAALEEPRPEPPTQAAVADDPHAAEPEGV